MTLRSAATGLIVALALITSGCGDDDLKFDAEEIANLEENVGGRWVPRWVQIGGQRETTCELPDGDGIEDRWTCVIRTDKPPRVRRKFRGAGITLPRKGGIEVIMEVWVNSDGFFSGVQVGGTDMHDIPIPEGVHGYLGLAP